GAAGASDLPSGRVRDADARRGHDLRPVALRAADTPDGELERLLANGRVARISWPQASTHVVTLSAAAAMALSLRPAERPPPPPARPLGTRSAVAYSVDARTMPSSEPQWPGR